MQERPGSRLYARTFTFLPSAVHSTVGAAWCDWMASEDAHLAVDHTNLGLGRIAFENDAP